MTHKKILLIISGGIAAYKCLELIRRLKEQNVTVRTVMTDSAQKFITPLAVGALTNERVFTDLFDLNDEREIGHIRLSREADLVVVAPATANLIAKMAGGIANDLASAVLLATNKPVLVAPAMNPHMWQHPATLRNVAQIAADGADVLEPDVGEMAESGEAGPGRLPDVPVLVNEIMTRLNAIRTDGAPHPATSTNLAGRHVLITSGPTHEPIDPVRYIANRSSGKQGHALAIAAAQAGARVTLITGPVALADPTGVTVVHVESASEMLAAVKEALPADIAVFAAAVADWRVEKPSGKKIKKAKRKAATTLALSENPDILKTIATGKRRRPDLVIGFAAETNDVLVNAKKKLKSKGADWIVANDVSSETGVMGGDMNRVYLLTKNGVQEWPQLPKSDVAVRILAHAAQHLEAKAATKNTAAE